MRKIKTLKVELILQICLTVAGILYSLSALNHSDASIAYFISLAVLGLANGIGFIIRLFSAKSMLNMLYLIIIGFYVFLSYVLVKIDGDAGLYFIAIGAGFINVYYLVYGFLLIKGWKSRKDAVDI